MPLMVKIGDKVKHERFAQTITQAELAKKAGITAAALARIENNQSDPHVSTIRKLADALGVEPRYLIEG
jgi:HTH-type transcriptional regulator, cell division transcriptional repressor